MFSIFFWIWFYCTAVVYQCCIFRRYYGLSPGKPLPALIFFREHIFKVSRTRASVINSLPRNNFKFCTLSKRILRMISSMDGTLCIFRPEPLWSYDTSKSFLRFITPVGQSCNIAASETPLCNHVAAHLHHILFYVRPSSSSNHTFFLFFCARQ